MNDNNEIVNITPDNIKSISVITSPGSEYDAEVESVIRIRTKERRANGFSLRADALGKYNNGYLITSLSTPGIRPENSR